MWQMILFGFRRQKKKPETKGKCRIDTVIPPKIDLTGLPEEPKRSSEA